MPTDQVKNYTVSYTNEKEFKGLVREVFMRNTYFVELDTETPTIYDIGAHVGLSTLYYKKLFPKSTIIAVEPHPVNIQLFKQNMDQNKIQGVHLIEVAVATNQGNVTLYSDHTDDQWLSNSRLKPDAWDDTPQKKEFRVPAVTLDQLITSHADVVKMDIEGLETEVITSSTKVFQHVDTWLIEYHPAKFERIYDLFNYLKEQDYHIALYKNGFGIPLKQARGLVLMEAKRKI